MSRDLKEERTVMWIFRKRAFQAEGNSKSRDLRQDCPLVNPGIANEPVRLEYSERRHRAR